MRGGYGSGSGPPLHARTRAGVDRTPPAAVSPPERDAGPGRHCWISMPVDGSEPRPGLLVEWRLAERGRWEGRVVYLARLRTGRWALVEEWVPAELLTPATTLSEHQGR